jgi:hypothetical protein
MPSWQEDVRPGMSIWHINYGNGVIEEIDYENRLVYCVFDFNNVKTPRAFDIEDVEGNYDERLNQWVLPVPF